MFWKPTYHQRLAQITDGLVTALSFVGAYLVWGLFRAATGISRGIDLSLDDLFKVLVFSVLWVAIFTGLGAYSYQRFTSISGEFKVVAKTTLIGVFFFFAVYFLFRLNYIPRAFILIFAAVNFLLLCAEKAGIYSLAQAARRKGINRKRVLIVGTGKIAANFIDIVKRNFEWGIDIVGLTSGDKSKVGTDILGYRVLGVNHEIERVLHENVIDDVMICVPTSRFEKVRNVLDCCEREGVQVRLISDFFSEIVKKVKVDNIYGLPIISFSMVHDREFMLYVKRLTDIAVSGALLVFLLPLLLIIAVLVKATSKGPLFYEWNVVGLNKKEFKSWKFRTMVQNADALKKKLMKGNEMKGPVFKMESDPRITGVGRFLREYSLDELPQLWSVFKGDMSLVGPRPPLRTELTKFDSWHRRKLSMKPGITCLWQVNGRNKINDFDDWAKLDLEYIDNWSLWLDIKILLQTVRAVLKGSGK